MEVQIMEQKQSPEHAEAVTAERQDLVVELGLTETARQDRTFPEMTEEMQRVYHLLLPHKEKWDRYQGYIPTAVLRVIKKEKDNFSRLYICSDKQGDPILIGTTSAERWDTGYQEFLLAIWGPVLVPFEQLKEKAMRLWAAKRTAKIKAVLAQVEADTINHFNGEHVASSI